MTVYGFPNCCIEIDAAGPVYVRFISDRKLHRTVELTPSLLVDLDADGRVLGVELLPTRKEVAVVQSGVR